MYKREAARGDVGDIVEPLDDVGLPQRLGLVQGARVQARDLYHQLPPVAGLRQRDMADVVFDVDVVIVNPVGAIESPRRFDQPVPEDLDLLHPGLEEIEYRLEAQRTAGRGRRVVDAERRHLHQLVSVIHFKKQAVDTGEVFHHRSLKQHFSDGSGASAAIKAKHSDVASWRTAVLEPDDAVPCPDPPDSPPGAACRRAAW